MNNYGHPLGFGVQIRGDANAPRAAVEVAVLAEQVGYDLVAFRDLPPEDVGPDAFSLSAWAAARSTRVQIAPWILTSARPASVVSRTIGSLQLLSGDRTVLVIDAADGGEGIDAVKDAVAVIRSLQDTSRRSRASHRGAHHRLSGAERGPSLEREVPLWLAGDNPAVAALAGRVADGWLTDLGAVGPEGVAVLTEILDASADAAGRDPREIRRAVVVVGDEHPSVPTLVALAVDHGVSSFVLRVGSVADAANTVRSFMAETVAEVREAVQRALPPRRHSSTPCAVPTARPPPCRHRLRRRARRWRTPPSSPATSATRGCGPPTCAAARPAWCCAPQRGGGGERRRLRPRARHLPLAIRSGGHGISGRSTNDGGIVIDCRHARTTSRCSTRQTRRVRIGPGARWMDVAAALGRTAGR